MATSWAGKENWMEARKKEKYTGGEAVHTRSEGPTILLCGDTNVACIWITGEFSLVTKYNENFGQIQKTLHSWWRREVAKQIMVYRDHNQEADHWANIGAHGRRRKTITDRRDESTVWKAIRGFWDGIFKNDGKSGCGIVIKEVNREKMGDNQ